MPTIFHKQYLEEPDWLAFAYVVGYDEGGEGGEGESEGGEGEEGEGEGEEGDDESQLPDNIKAILKKERELRATAEKKAKLLERNAKSASKGTGKGAGKANEGAKNGSQGTEDEEDGQASDPRYAKMVEKFRTNSLRDTVAKLAQNFADPNDVYRFLDTDLFDFTQDEDDPSEVVWDEAEIRAAVKGLAKEKPYLLKPAGEGTGTRKAGPKFAGSGSGRQTSGLSTDEMGRRFPAMRHAVRAGTNKNE